MEGQIQLNVAAWLIEVTENFRAFVEEKLLDALRGLGDTRLDAITVAIELERTPARRRKGNLFRAEATINLPRSAPVRVVEVSDSMEKAVIQLKHTLARELRSWRERLIGEKRSMTRSEREESMSRDVENESEAEIVD